MSDEKSKNNLAAIPEENDSNGGAINPEIFDQLPPDIKKTMEIGFSMQKFSGPLPSPLLEKINEQHIDKILDLTEKEDDRLYKDTQSSKLYSFIYFISVIFLFVFLTIYLARSNPELYSEILKLSVAFVGGLGGGYGIKSYIGSK